jgi:hypothetical protein
MLVEAGTLRHDPVEAEEPPREGHGSILYCGLANEAEDQVTIRLVDSKAQRHRATSLLNRMYSWRGYSTHQLSSMNGCDTFAAYSGECLIGTLTLQVDSPFGLQADGTFKQEIDSFRAAPGAKLSELTRFAFSPSIRSRPILAALFHIIFMFGSRRYGCTDLLIEVNPRHVRFYEVMLGFSRVGSVKTNPSVDAPAQLMWLKISEIRRRIDLHTGNATVEGHSLYRYFFSKEEERRILAGMTGLTRDRPVLTKAA